MTKKMKQAIIMDLETIKHREELNIEWINSLIQAIKMDLEKKENN